MSEYTHHGRKEKDSTSLRQGTLGKHVFASLPTAVLGPFPPWVFYIYIFPPPSFPYNIRPCRSFSLSDSVSQHLPYFYLSGSASPMESAGLSSSSTEEKIYNVELRRFQYLSHLHDSFFYSRCMTFIRDFYIYLFLKAETKYRTHNENQGIMARFAILLKAEMILIVCTMLIQICVHHHTGYIHTYRACIHNSS